jgi:DNA-binding CsgD family transcriptional regulator
VLDRLLASARAGRSATVVLRGGAGIGKTALLHYVLAGAHGCTTARTAGVESEMELAFAGLQQFCAPFLDRLDRAPDPQREALSKAFGLSHGDRPDRFLIGLAVLGLLSDVAEERPLVCVVDDVQWLDHASVQVLGFVARRLQAESIALVFAVRETGGEDDLTGLDEIRLDGLADNDARALLDSVLTGPLEERVRDRIVAETRGNPLALLELPRGLTPEALAGGFGSPAASALPGHIEASFQRRLAALPPPTRRLLLVAAAEPLGDPLLVKRAAERLGVEAATGPAIATGLLDLGWRVRFQHPLVRSAVYRGSSVQERRSVHGALADVTDPDVDPDRRAWHRAQAAPGPDEDVAAALERSAGRAQGRGGLAAAAAFLERAAELTPEPADRSRRALAAAQSKHEAGAPDASLKLLALAHAGPLDDLAGARAERLRAQIAFAVTHGRDAPPLLLNAARRLEPLDARLARETYLDAFSAALFAGRLGGDGLRKVADAVLAANWGTSPEPSLRALDLLLEGLAVLVVDGYAAGIPTLAEALSAFREDAIADEDALRWLWLACRVARALGDDTSWDELSERQVRLARKAGALGLLPTALTERFNVQLLSGNLAAATALAAEAEAVLAATGSRLSPRAAISLATWRGSEEQALALDNATREDVAHRGEGLWLAAADWNRAVLCNGLGQHEEALVAAERAAEHPHELGFTTWVWPELVEAAARTGNGARAVEPLRRFSEVARASGTQWLLGIEARSRALLSEGEAAERLYREAIERLERTRIRVALARGRLNYGEWLRRQKRRAEAREQLRGAYDLFVGMGYETFAERTRRELLATGETVRKRTSETRDQLTAQETQIATYAAEGQTNPEIGALLFLSPRTVEWHLRKVFGKLGVSSRRELGEALAG